MNKQAFYKNARVFIVANIRYLCIKYILVFVEVLFIEYL